MKHLSCYFCFLIICCFTLKMRPLCFCFPRSWNLCYHYLKIIGHEIMKVYLKSAWCACSLQFHSLSFFFKRVRPCDLLWASSCFRNLSNSSPPSDNPPVTSCWPVATCQQLPQTDQLFLSFIFFSLSSHTFHITWAHKGTHISTLTRSNWCFFFHTWINTYSKFCTLNVKKQKVSSSLHHNVLLKVGVAGVNE